MSLFAVLAALVVLLHVAFLVFVVSGGALALRWPRAMWVHLPAVAWAAWIEFSGNICPLTPLENDLRARAGLAPYEGDFIANWVFPILYPEGLTRESQLLLGAGAVVINLVVYASVVRCRRTRRRAEMADAACYTSLRPPPGRPGSSVGRAYD
jgi:hypothetical protein